MSSVCHGPQVRGPLPTPCQEGGLGGDGCRELVRWEDRAAL